MSTEVEVLSSTCSKEAVELTSATTSLHPLASCLHEFQKSLELLEQQWLPDISNSQKTALQEAFVELVPDAAKDLTYLSPDEAAACVSEKVAVVNKFLVEQGFNIQLEDRSGGVLFVASVLKIAALWGRGETVSSPLKTPYGTVPAVLASRASVFTSPAHPYPIAELKTQNGDVVLITRADTQRSSVSLVRYFSELHSVGLTLSNEFSGVHFPMVHYEEEIDITWLQGLKIENTMSTSLRERILRIPRVPFFMISQAKQFTSLKLNEHGIKVESAAAMSLARGRLFDPRPRLIIDQPFYLWIKRKEMKYPYFAGLFSPKHWRDPGSF